MIILLGGSGYLGKAYIKYFEERGIGYKNLSRREFDYYNPDKLASFLKDVKADFLINAAGYTGRPNVDACENNRAQCLLANAVLPGLVRLACEQAGKPWGHVSSGCVFSGSSGHEHGFREEDPPNFDFRHNNCSFYSGSKALGEECLEGGQSVYIWRLRMPFNHEDSSRNYLSKVQRYERLVDVRNSMSHLNEFVEASYKCWENRVPFGTYNVTNTGSVTTREVIDMIKRILKVDKEFKFFESEDEFLKIAVKVPRSNLEMDNSKLLSAGIHVSEIHDAMEQSLRNWKLEEPVAG